MDLNQLKLTRSEWESIEVPVSTDEKEVLNLIISSFNNVNIKYNKFNSLFTYLKIEYSEEIENLLYNKYFATHISKIQKKHPAFSIIIDVNSKKKVKTADSIRIERNDISKMNSSIVYEYLLIEIIENIYKYSSKNSNKWLSHYFTLYKLIRYNVLQINRHITTIINFVLTTLEDKINMMNVVENSVQYIEKNELLLKYADMMLYDHQKQIYTVNRSIIPKLVLYIAPTGTGKTLTPIGLSEGMVVKYKINTSDNSIIIDDNGQMEIEYETDQQGKITANPVLIPQRIIFVCAARHVGLALARSAISVGKKIAFAFGCASADDIRLHYFAAKECKRNKKTGRICKVDNSVGDKVEIIICDLKSYLPAMYYMLSFNQTHSITVCWDEPTITMDYANHELHEIIQKNWCENLIPNMILSSATLPKLHELVDTVADFKLKFPGAEIHNIVSNDCKKSIPIVNKNGYVVLPHYLSDDYDKILEIVDHCNKNLTLLRYFDMTEVVNFIIFVEKNNFVKDSSKIDRRFASLNDVTMQNIKLHYLDILSKIKLGTWGAIVTSLKSMRVKRILPNTSIDIKGARLTSSTSSSMQEEGNCAIYVSTKDAYTLTDGPTIFLAEDVEKVAKFYIQQANIPVKVMEDIMDKIDFNNKINDKLSILEKDLEDIEAAQSNTINVSSSDASYGGKNYTPSSSSKKNQSQSDDSEASSQNVAVNKIKKEIETLQSMIKIAELNETFIPNKHLHVKKWAESFESVPVFTSDIDEYTIIKIMLLKDVSDSWKILLLMGIGVFTNHKSVAYTEIMKGLADQQKLYMIIASSDYIYGTNYQFCHGYLSKDMILTQEKIIQAFGRIGRNNIQQNYSIRLRDDEIINKLFYNEPNKPEVTNMNKLFNTSN